jgi:hypothetical protein
MMPASDAMGKLTDVGRKKGLLFLKKRSKKLDCLASASPGETRPRVVKVFGFFSSEKKIVSCL